jgi:hypothetical protein
LSGFRPGKAGEGNTLLNGYTEALREQFGHLPGRPALTRLDLLYRGERAIYAFGKVFLGEIEDFTALLEPLSKG